MTTSPDTPSTDALLTPEAGGPGGPGRMEERVRRAIIALGLTGAFGLLVVVIVTTSPGAEPVVRFVGGMGAVLLLALVGVELVGLLQRRPWAVVASAPLLFLLVLAGTITFVDSLQRGSLNIPIVPLVCIWALWPRPSAGSAPPLASIGQPDRRRVIAVSGAFLVALAWPLIAGELLKPGGLLVSAPTDLAAAIELSCQDGVVPDESVTVTYRWSWNRREPIVGGEDRLTISWTGIVDDEQDPPALLADQPSRGLSQADMTLDAGQMAVVYAVDLGLQGFQPGMVQLTLARQPVGQSGHGSISVDGRYVRASSVAPSGLWESLPASATCTW